MSSFITKHLVKKIESEVREKSSILKIDGFCYFDTPIELKSKLDVAHYKNKTINRVNKFSPYISEEVIPFNNWYMLKPETLIEIYDRLKNNNFFVYKKIDDRSHKIRLKKK